mmetsp:Transcript_5122/g.10275  ORF Transcript_5122/g.10275 Transcript_5122/m.10275 type:complete len:275 (+) Transcript_5122:376-1200(+)
MAQVHHERGEQGGVAARCSVPATHEHSRQQPVSTTGQPGARNSGESPPEQGQTIGGASSAANAASQRLQLPRSGHASTEQRRLGIGDLSFLSRRARDTWTFPIRVHALSRHESGGAQRGGGQHDTSGSCHHGGPVQARTEQEGSRLGGSSSTTRGSRAARPPPVAQHTYGEGLHRLMGHARGDLPAGRPCGGPRTPGSICVGAHSGHGRERTEVEGQGGQENSGIPCDAAIPTTPTPGLPDSTTHVRNRGAGVGPRRRVDGDAERGGHRAGGSR